ncbi:MAG: formyltetrahydrofolate deformylase [Candidatus Omnitrophica bacterium]|nr:formyltetrahydrofolate deformylase [Candidatus Omnitrophota bacterium]
MPNAILLISCPDQRGIAADVANFIFKHNGNVIHADEHRDENSNTFFLRIEWSLEDFLLTKNDIPRHFKEVADKFFMQWRLSYTDDRKRVAVFVSKHLHCLYDFLYRFQTGQYPCVVPLVISNHPDAGDICHKFSVRFEHISKVKENKQEQERWELQLLNENQIDVVVLARYHQILSGHFVAQFPDRIINIHHSFLPAFVGAEPYKQAHQKGVKVIGATSHYVTEYLDQGPIIEQDTVRVSHRDSIRNMKEKGEDLEKVVLHRAIKWHLEDKILRFGNKTVVFD